MLLIFIVREKKSLFEKRKKSLKKEEKMAFSCEILFEKNPKRVFYTGRSLYGSIRITLKNDKNIRSIFVKINGAAITICKADNFGEDCLNDRLEIIGDTRLAAGIHEFPFQFKIPPQLPSSYEGEYGFIRYMVTVTVHISKNPQKEFEKRVTILRLTDLNDPDLQVNIEKCAIFSWVFRCFI